MNLPCLNHVGHKADTRTSERQLAKPWHRACQIADPWLRKGAIFPVYRSHPETNDAGNKHRHQATTSANVVAVAELVVVVVVIFVVVAGIMVSRSMPCGKGRCQAAFWYADCHCMSWKIVFFLHI